MGNTESGPEVTQSGGVATAVGSVAGVNVKQTRSPTSISAMHHAEVFESNVEADTRQPTHSHQSEVRWTLVTREHSEIPLQQVHKRKSGTWELPQNTQNVHSVPVNRMVSPTNASELQQSESLFHDSDASDDGSEDGNEANKLLRRIAKLGSEVVEATAAVFHYLETKVMDDEMTFSGRSRHVLQMIKMETGKGNMQPAYKFLATAKAVSEVLEEEDDDNSESGVSLAMSTQSQALFRLLNDDDQHSISDQSAAIFKILEDMRSLNGEAERIETEGDAEGIETSTPIQSRDPPGVGMFNDDCNEFLIQEWCLPLSPKSQATQKASGAASTVLEVKDVYADRYLPGIPEVQSTADETEAPSQEEGRDGFSENYSDTYGKLFNVLGSDESNHKQDIPFIRRIGTSDETSVDLTDLPHLHLVDADMDLEFVENFDDAYNQFIAANPFLMIRNPDMVHNLRIYKLQKLLKYNELLERNLLDKLGNLNEEKSKMEETMQLQLRDAARKKAARQTFLQSELNNLGWSTKRLEAQLRWKSLEYSQDRAKRQFVLRQQYKTIPRANTRNELFQLIPEGPEGRQLMDLMVVGQHADRSKPYMLSPQQEEKLRKIQVENSVMNAEIATLNNKLAALQMEGKKFTWVESVLLKLDEATLFHFKQKFQKKEGLERI
jgi:hypothetical protein